ncbi:MAG: glycosyltransferase [Microthrixaceae bacterium]|nr:glycosyltransferase [Microthrixaceae bacterium]
MADDRIRVLWLAMGLGQGGMERLLVTHAQFGDRQRFDYRAAYLVDRPHSVIDELNELDVPTTRLGSGNAGDPRWVLELARLVRRERLDVVHAHSPMPASVARPLVRLISPRTRLIYTEHNRWDRYSAPTRVANRITYSLNHETFAVSDDCRDTVSPRLRPEVETLIHGIDVDAVAAHRADRESMRSELGISDETVVIGTVANLRVQKNYPLLLEVASEVTADNPDVLFLSVGQGPLEQELKALHQDLGLGDRFRFLGFRQDVHRVMSSFDAFCLSSDHEGLPVALMEAKTLGLPVVATAVGGVANAVGDGEDGLLVPARNPEALRVALERLINDPLQRGRLAESSGSGASAFRASRAFSALERRYVASSVQ